MIHRVKMLKKALLLLFLFTTVGYGEEITFRRNGELVKALSFESLIKLPGLAQSEVVIWDPLEEIDITYVVIRATDVFNQFYGELWRTTEEITFHTLDGFTPSIPVQKFLSAEAYFAFAAKGRPFSLLNKKKKPPTPVHLNPLYLVWENVKNQKMRHESLTSWPYQIVGLDLVKYTEKFPSMAPPAKSSPSAKKGFLYFRDHCSTCHSVNGAGGNKGPELATPVNITDYIKEPWLKRFILSPTSVRANATMPGFSVFEKKNPGAIDEIILYLKAMKK